MTTYYRIDDIHGNEVADGIQGDDVARRAAQDAADRLGDSVYLSGPDAVSEEFSPRRRYLTIRELSRTPSTHVTMPGALDIALDLSGPVSGRVEISLAPHPAGVGMAPYGDAEDHWISGAGRKLLDQLPAATRADVVDLLADWGDDAGTEATVEVRR